MSNEILNAEEMEEGDGISDLVEEVAKDEVALAPAETGDPASIVAAKIPADVRERYEVYSYRNAAAILCETRKEDFEDLLKALRAFTYSEGIFECGVIDAATLFTSCRERSSSSVGRLPH